MSIYLQTILRLTKKYAIHDVMTINGKEISGKEININVRVRRDVREDFKIVAELRGASMSSLIHQFMVKCIREEKKISPESFGNAEKPTGKYEQEAVIEGLTEK